MIKKRYPRLFGILPLLGMLLLSGCNLAVLNPKGQVGIDERNLIVTATILMLLVVVPVIVMTVVFAWKYRASNKNATYTPDWAHSYKIEAVTWSIPLLIIVALGIVTWETTHSLDPYRPLDSDVKPVTIQVIAQDWKWVFIYPDLGIATVNEVEFPANTPVNFRITSDSVMTSFFIPGLGGQIYAMAGMTTQLHLIANEQGVFDGMAANYSGEGFSDMKFKAHATTPAEFEAWVNTVKASPKQLQMDAYNALAKPSIKNPVEYFSAVQPNLFQTIVDKYEGMNMRLGGAKEGKETSDMSDMGMDTHSATGAEE